MSRDPGWGVNGGFDTQILCLSSSTLLYMVSYVMPTDTHASGPYSVSLGHTRQFYEDCFSRSKRSGQKLKAFPTLNLQSPQTPWWYHDTIFSIPRNHRPYDHRPMCTTGRQSQ